MAWTPHASDAEYWTSNNPFIIAWYRFGDDDPNAVARKVSDDSGNRSYASGLLVDSGPRKLHLHYKGVSDSFLKPSSGIAPWSSSGVIFGSQPSTTWVETTHINGIFHNPETYHETRTTTAVNKGLDPVSFGRETQPSGFTAMGWVRTPSTAVNTTLFRTIFGNTRAGDLSNGTFTIIYRPSDRNIIAGFKIHADASVPTVASAGDTSDDESFFLAVQMHRELAIPGGWVNGAGGSGLLKLYIGTVDSPLTLVATTAFNRSETRLDTPSSQNILTFGQDCDIFIGGTSDRHLPPSSILDEWVLVNDGLMSEQRMAHYMNSGIQYVSEDDPCSPDFVPLAPGTDDLVAYWSFDDQTGENTAPATEDLNLDFVMNPSLGNNITPVPGVHGGSGISPGGALASDNVLSDITNAREAFPHIPRNSGLNQIFPDVHVSDQWTWIGWMRSRVDGSNHYGGTLGWFVEAGSDFNTAIGIGDWNNQNANTGADDRGRGLEWSASGIQNSFNSGPDGTTGDDGGNEIGVLGGIWQLWAFVFDFRHGVLYSVRDAKHTRIESTRLSSVSGFNKDLIDLDGAFVLASIANSNNDQLAEFDDWAIYNRALSIPEMSGYAVSGISTFTPVSPLSVSFKQSMAYWPLDGSGTYDPDVLAGTRFEDAGWYRHHLTNVSGAFSQATALNTYLGDNSVQLDTSGSMLSLERVFTGANLDFSTDQTMSSSGFSAGMWAYVPSGDISTQGNGSSGLFGEHILMGNWSQDSDERSWYLGINNNLPEAHIVLANLTDNAITSNVEIPFNTPFFLGLDVQPSGATLNGRLWYALSGLNPTITQIGETSFGSSTDLLNPTSASGFSLFNGPNLNYGFPQTTRGQGAFVYNGALTERVWAFVKQAGIDQLSIVEDDVSTSDPDNISHWKLDRQGTRFVDFGKEQNFLFPINQDGHLPGTIAGIHSSGVVIRQPEYYDTLAGNPNSNRLDLGSGSDSWTFLGWVYPPNVTNQDRHYIMAKSDGASGVQLYTPDDSLQLTTNASGATSLSQNGNLAPDDWNHIAVVYDRDNDEFTTIINGRYAGPGFLDLPEIPVNNSGLALGGRGDQLFDALAGGSAFSGYMDDVMLFSRALTLPEISGLAANSYGYNEGLTEFTGGPIGIYMSGIIIDFVSGLIGSFVHGQAQDLELIAGYVSGVSGVFDHIGGFMHGKASVSGQLGSFLHGAGQQSGIFGQFVHGFDRVSGFIGSYSMGACADSSEFDIVLDFRVVSFDEFDARLGVEKTKLLDFDARLGIIRITEPPDCTLELPLVGTIVSGLPYELTVTGSGIARNDKKVSMVRFTFADFKGAESGTLIDGVPNSGLYSATRVFDTPGWYNVKIEVLDSYGYRTSCVRPFLLNPSGTPSGTFINSLPGISLSGTPILGSAIQAISFTHSLSGLDTTSGLLEYTDFANQQESLVNSLEMPSGTQFVNFVRRHDYTMPGRFSPVWSVSGEFGIVSDTIAGGIDYIV